ncbi:hypothetical protein FACUT_3176 [Fusarium acutatum]|uniref:DUF6546 domain-containing protein n=1 Tax=Fusarium acutatum TaxID=78861 RepID=A0A8H4K1A3_9HYPO|nr:hypothetical protein FACUT_3176 [Fusarium acutatum]
MAFPPDTTASWIPASRPTLPFDVELFIVNDLIELYKSTHKRLATLATVSRTWQCIVEKHTFQDLKLKVQELPVFQKFVQRGRLQFVKSITLRVRGGLSCYGVCDWSILPNIFSSVVSSTTAIASIHIEKWWNVFGICGSRANMELLDLISQAADHLEHIAVSYAISANYFFERCREVEFKQLKTLALTYHFNGIPSNKFSNIASQAVARMPALEMLEIWEFGLQGLQAHIFRLPTCVDNAWKNVFRNRTLEVEERRFVRDEIITFSDILPHLMLKEQILHASTRKRILELATVSKTWQVLIEKETYNHIKIASHELDSFKHHVRSYRKLFVIHILLEISYNFFLDELDDDSDQVQFSKAVHALWRILSRWKTHRVTVELGIVSTQARRFIEARRNPLNPSYTLDPHFWSCFDLFGSVGPRAYPTLMPSLSWLFEGSTSQTSISPITLYEIISSAPCIESIHLERWCYGNLQQDRNWDCAFQRPGLLVPDSTKGLAYFEEFHTPYHQQNGAMVLPRSNRTLLESIFGAADSLEHIAVSFTFDAQTFFDRLIGTDFKALETLALTSSFNNLSQSLLDNAAEAVKKMHALKILEIWNFEAGQADVFRYKRLDRYLGRITWQSTKHRKICSDMERSWKDLLRRCQSGFDVKRSSFPMEIKSLQDLLPHLKLGEQILRNFT